MKNHPANSDSESFVEVTESQRMTSQQLHDLVHDHERFLSSVHKLNEEAETKIQDNNYQEALAYLTQAEQILEYAASCGKNIDRQLIISVLHNEACANQKSWELINCSNYLEALIYNMNEYLKLGDASINKKYSSSVSTCSQNFVDKSLRLVKYHLQYAAINSQLKNHGDAFDSSKRAIELLQLLFKSLNKNFKHEKQFDNGHPAETKLQTELKYKIMESLENFDYNFSIQNLEDYISTAEYFFQIWKKSKPVQQAEGIQEGLKKFSIGTVMQIGCDSQEEKRNLEGGNIYFDTSDSLFSHSRKFDARNQNYQKTLEKVLVFSIAFFTAATELRLSSSQKYKVCLETWKNSPEFKESKIYHLFSLMLVFAYVPFDMQFVTHVINSYNKNYTSETELFKQTHAAVEGGSEEVIRQFDPENVHQAYLGKHSSEEEGKKPVQILPKFVVRSQIRTHKSAGTLAKLQKKCKHIINKKYMTPKQDETKKIQSSKSLTYIHKKRTKTNRSDKSKKSFSVSKKVNLTANNLNLQDYYSAKRKKKEKRPESEVTIINKVKGYYDAIMFPEKKKSEEKLTTIKSLQTFRKNKPKSKILISKEEHTTMKEKKKKTKSKHKDIKGLKSVKTLVLHKKRSEVLTSIIKTPQYHNKKEHDFSEYYD